MDTTANGKGVFTSSGSVTMACLTLGLCGNPGGPAFLPERGVCRTTEEGERQNEAQGVGWPSSTVEGG